MDKQDINDNHVPSLNADMRNQWYALSYSHHLNPRDVVSLNILGDPVVLYRDRTGKVGCLADRCAHRSAPLSIGQVVDEELECKYHGWKYSTDGRVTNIPALLEGRSIPGNASVYAYPIEEIDGIIWVWPGSLGHEGCKRSKIPRIIPDFGYPFFQAVDMDIDHSLLIENLLDPAHLPFTHDGTLSSRSNAGPIEMKHIHVEFGNKFSRDLDYSIGVLTATMDLSNKSGDTHTEFYFLPPCTVMLHHTFPNGKRFHQVMVCVPRKPGHLRLLYCHSFEGLPPLHLIPGFNWYMDKYVAKIQFQDYELLHGQQARLQQGSKAWHSQIQVDGLPKQYRIWLRKASEYDFASSKFSMDDYGVLLNKGPYFKGWKHCSIKDIEDISHPCKLDCSVPETNLSSGEIDDLWSIPNQKGVDNSAYTWRRDLNLGKNVSNISTSALLIFGALAAAGFSVFAFLNIKL